jgi:hypothetical protein
MYTIGHAGFPSYHNIYFPSPEPHCQQKKTHLGVFIYDFFKYLLCDLVALLLANPRDGAQVDAVAVPGAVREVVPEVRAVDADRFAVREHADVLPRDFGVAERRPPVRRGLGEEGLRGAPDRRAEQRLERHGVEKGHRRLGRRAGKLGREARVCKGAGPLGIVAVEAADLARGKVCGAGAK